MSNHGCVNGTLVANFAAPVPVIGLYITAASLVFLMLMLYDIKAAFHTRRRWIPCKSFTLNSVTLTLLAIATKLPIDLTTSMPRPIDQISKLTGTVLICIVMGFLAPSLGLGNKRESLMNMAALSMFVLTIVVNVCIQISTGVIVLFVPEHIIILVCMLFLLLMLWSITMEVEHNNQGYKQVHEHDLFYYGQASVLDRLKDQYWKTYDYDPQYSICRIPPNACIALVCLVCLVVQLQGAIRSLILKKMEFCNGVSDYSWSMTPIVLTQILGIIVASLAISFRSLTMFCYTSVDFNVRVINKVNLVINNNPTLRKVSMCSYGDLLALKCMIALRHLEVWIITLPALAIQHFGLVEKKGDRGILLRKAEQDIERMMDAGGNEFPQHLHQLLDRIRPSGYLPASYGIDASPLSIVFLVRIAQFYLPDDLSQSLLQSFPEANEIIHFVYKTVWPNTVKNKNTSLFAKAVWAGRDFNSLMPDDLDCTNMEFAALSTIMPSDAVSHELDIIMEIIGKRSYPSVEDLRAMLEQLFIDCLHTLLTQLPIAIFQSWNESPAQELNKRARFALKLLFKIQNLENQVAWVLPADPGINSFITTPPVVYPVTESEPGSSDDD